MVGDLVIGRVMLVGLGLRGLEGDFVDFGDFLFEILLELLELGKGDWVGKFWKGVGGVWRWVLRFGEGFDFV